MKKNHCKHSQQAIVPAAGNIAATAADAIPTVADHAHTSKVGSASLRKRIVAA